MSHPQQKDFCITVQSIFPLRFENATVLDIGSLDINGNNRYLFKNCEYTGIDIGEGKNVDIVCKGHEFKPADGKKYDVVISTECFEHDMFYEQTIQNIVNNLLKPGGLFLFTCATTGRAEHVTARTSPADSPFTSHVSRDATESKWADYYKNLEESDIRKAIDIEKNFEHHFFAIGEETHDLYFFGVKRE